MTQQQIKGATGDLGADARLDVYDVPGSAIVTPYSVSATFDGSGAAGAFLPCLTFKTQTGAIIARCPAPEVAAGDTAEVSWFPHVAAPSTGTGGGIDFDQPNIDPLGAGGELTIDTGFIEFGNNIPADWEIDAIDFQLTTTGSSGVDVEVGGGTMQLNSFEVAGQGGVFSTSGERSNTARSGDTALQIRSGGVYQLSATLPTVDPGVSGQLWNDLGTLKVSP